MAWTSPMTATANSAFTAAQFNTHVRDNLLETAPAKATAAGQYFLSTGTNAIAARTFGFNTVGTSESTTSSSYTDLNTAGPSVTVTTGTTALVLVSAQAQQATANVAMRIGVAVTGATSRAADDSSEWLADGAPAAQPISWSRHRVFTDLTAGSNTFTLKYKTTTSTATFAERELFVMALN